MRLSFDGQMVLANPDTSVWAIDSRSNLKTRIANASGGVWMPDGRNVIYRATDGLWLKSVTGEGQPRSIVKFASRGLIPTSVSSDGLRVAVTARPDAQTPSQDIWLITIADGSAQPLLATGSEEEQASFSPIANGWPTPRTRLVGWKCTSVRLMASGRPFSSRPTVASIRCGAATDRNCFSCLRRTRLSPSTWRPLRAPGTRRPHNAVPHRAERHHPREPAAVCGRAGWSAFPPQRPLCARAAVADTAGGQVGRTPGNIPTARSS